ncbi:hypothetical protein ACWC9T_17290 [Kitasatospora sp. NPDC001159]
MREQKSLAIRSQLINCTASEVAATVEGTMRHGTTMDDEANYTIRMASRKPGSASRGSTR